MDALNKSLTHTHDWAIDRITTLTEEGNHDQLEDAFAIEREFDEWLNALDEEHKIYSLEYIGEGSEYD
jgi:hypothetical protein